jgi:hypothetical protein
MNKNVFLLKIQTWLRPKLYINDHLKLDEWYRLRWVVQTHVSGTDSDEWYRLRWVVHSGEWYRLRWLVHSDEWYRLRWVVQTQMNGTDSDEWYRLRWVVQTRMSGTDSGEHLVCIITNSYERWDNKYDCIDRCCIYQTNTKPTCQYIFFWIIVEKYLVQ